MQSSILRNKMKFLVFQHVPHEPLGLIADFAKKKSIELEIIELWKPYSIPSVLRYDALIIMGGPMGVYEEEDIYPSKNDEIKAIKEGLGEIPMFGFCLGHQLLASFLGAKVHPNIKNKKKIKEIGYYNIELTSEGKRNPLFKGFTSPIEVFQWHGDVCELPKNATLLASSPLCNNQAFNYKNVFGIQFHFEITPEMIEKLIEFDNNWIHTDFDLDEDTLRKQAKEKEKLMKAQSDGLLENFVAFIRK
jgi:GMP synthase (glutamine-hydrolysing)